MDEAHTHDHFMAINVEQLENGVEATFYLSDGVAHSAQIAIVPTKKPAPVSAT